MSDAKTIADRYELGERLGLGGMSTVVAAFDRRLERRVAVKLLAEHLADDAQFVSRFRREALAAAQLVHPNIVQVFDFGLDAQSGRHYIVMERVNGRSALELLREHGRLEPEFAVDIIEQACRGLAEAHRHGVVHRDVKPANLLRSDDRLVKVADFGIARNLADESGITQVGSVIGTASYLSPEQTLGERATSRSDIYALGVVAYQLLSGDLPYAADSISELAAKQQREAPPLLNEFVDGVSPALAAAIDQALALDPADRFEDADELRRALLAGADSGEAPTGVTRIARTSGQPTTVHAPVTSEHTTIRKPRQPRQPRPAPSLPTPPPAAAKPARRRRRGRGLVSLIVALMILGGAAAAVATTNDQTAVQLRRVTSERANGIIDQLDRLISDNTR